VFNMPTLEPKPSTIPVLKGALREYYGKERTNIHVSDINSCMRQKIFRKEQPMELTDKELNNFSSGRGIDGCIQDLTYMRPKQFRAKTELWLSRETGEIIHWFNAKADDVVATPDIYDIILDMPIELKSNKTETIWMDKFNTMSEPPPASNVKQLLYYMAMTDKNYGRLLIQYMNQKKKSPWREIDYYRTKEELAAIRQEIAHRARLYKIARDAKDPSLALHVANDPDEKYLCKMCPYKSPCDEMRRKAGEIF